MRILVTGGAGFIGSHYVRTLLAGGYPGYEDARVTVLDSLTYAGNLANLAPVSVSPRLEFVRGDIADAALVGSLVPGHDAVINFAAETHVDRSIAGASPFVATNVAGRSGDRAVVSGQPRLAGAAEAAGRERGGAGGRGGRAGAGRRRAGVMSRWLVTGAGGILGRDLVTLLGRCGESVTAWTGPALT